MPLEQFLTGATLPWLRPEDQNTNAMESGSRMGTSFMENSMRQQEMQQKAITNPIAVQMAQDDEKIKSLQIAQGVFMQKERVNKEAGATAAAALLSTLPDQEGGAANFPATLDKVIKGAEKFGNDFLDNPFTEKLLSDSKQAYQTKNSLENFQKNLAVKQGQVDVNQQRADTLQQKVDDLSGKWQATLKSNQDIQAAHDATKLQLGVMTLDKKMHEEKSRINDVTFAGFEGEKIAIQKDPDMPLPTKLRKIEELTKRFEDTLAKRRDEKAGRAAVPDASTATPPGYQPAVIDGMPNVSSKDEYLKLPSGTKFIRDGKTFVKP